MKEGAIANVSITDPDISGRIDALLVQKVQTSNNKVVKNWRLMNYQATEDIDLEDGKFYLKIFPYFINIDPLPVWFRVDNNGSENLLIQCVITEKRPGFKNVKKLRSGESIDIAGCYKLEYRVVRFSLRNLGVQFVDGVGRVYRNRLLPLGIMKIGDLAGKEALELSKATKIPVIKLAEWIRKAEIACGLKVSQEEFESIGEELVIDLLNTPVDDLVEKTGRTKKQIEELMDTIGNLTIVIDADYAKKMPLENLFE